MELIPAIDLRGGKCVRLTQGDYDRETVFSDDPLAMAEHWVAAGARRLHIVDLDGARDGVRANSAIVGRLTRETHVPVQVGGGIRTAADAARLVDLGVDRVIFGTAAIEARPEVETAAKTLGSDRIIVGIDARDGIVASRGWIEETSWSAIDLIRDMQALGVQRFIHTDIGRDGTLSGPNVEVIEVILKSVHISLVAAGGLASIADLQLVAALGVEAVVIGTALYTGAIDFKDAAGKF